MKIIKLYNSIVLPNSRIYMPKDKSNCIDNSTLSINDDIAIIISKTKKINSITMENFYSFGVFGKIVDEENNILIIETYNRIHLDYIEELEDNKYEIKISNADTIHDLSLESEKNKLNMMKRELSSFVEKYEWGIFARAYIMRWNSINEIIGAFQDFIVLSSEEKYKLLEYDSDKKRVEEIEKVIYEYINITKINNEAEDKEKKETEKIYREHALKKQIEYMQNELDKMHPEEINDIKQFEIKINNSSMNDFAKREALKVINRMKQEGSNSQEYGMLYDYIDFMTTLSWKKEEYNEIDISKAKKILDENHFGLKKVKKRIIEEIAIMNLNKKQSGSILLFVGPPGVGKTSIARAIALAMNRQYIRISLGGIKDEAEIRGHRRTYVGALPGRILDGISKCKTTNPVMVLDEVDKIASSYNNDPASALLEVLDPEQNFTFTDHYLNVPYDLSDVFFICTANSAEGIPEALLNRMEIIEFNGYSPIEKLHIAKRHLLPEVLKNSGLTKKELSISDSALKKIIFSYTMESGVRSLKRILSHLAREVAVKIVTNEDNKIEINSKNVHKYIESREIRHDRVTKNRKAGIVTGLAWTSVGGEILFIESLFTKGDGKVIITGQLGDVMKESVQIAISLVKELYPDKVELFKENDLHIHVPEGATPKDGPSAGITITTTLASLLLDKKVSEKVAMTGEISLRGNLIPIGGLPEKLMAAERAGIKTVFIPKENVFDLKDVAKEILDKLDIIPVNEVTEVLKKLNLY